MSKFVTLTLCVLVLATMAQAQDQSYHDFLAAQNSY